MKLEERICACGCRKTFKCLPSSGTRYSSLHCMEAAGALPPVDKFGRGMKPARSDAGPPKVDAKPIESNVAKAELAAPAKSGKAVAAATSAPQKNLKAAAKSPQKSETKAAASKTPAKAAAKKSAKPASSSGRSKRAPEASL